MKIIGVIPARYRSSRFPGKPLADICGKPMIWWVYQQCKKVARLDDLYVATDDSRIFDTCTSYDMHVMMTSESHKTGSDRVGEVSTRIDGDLFINIQGDEPLINPNEIEEIISEFDDPEVYFGTLKTEISDPDEIAADSTVKVVCDKNDYAMYFSRNIIPSNKKDDPYARVFRHVGIYAYKRDFLQKFINLPQTELELGEGIEPLRALENGYKVKVKETRYQSIGVDYPEQIDLVEEQIRKNFRR